MKSVVRRMKDVGPDANADTSHSTGCGPANWPIIMQNAFRARVKIYFADSRRINAYFGSLVCGRVDHQ